MDFGQGRGLSPPSPGKLIKVKILKRDVGIFLVEKNRKNYWGRSQRLIETIVIEIKKSGIPRRGHSDIDVRRSPVGSLRGSEHDEGQMGEKFPASQRRS